MIRTVNQNEEFLFLNSQNIKCFAPAKSRIYVLFADNGNGKTQPHGRVDRCDREPVPPTNGSPEIIGHYTELGFIRTGVEIPGNDPDLYNKGHQAVLNKLAELNPSLEFEIF